jgi:hypothetical protein
VIYINDLGGVLGGVLGHPLGHMLGQLALSRLREGGAAGLAGSRVKTPIA